MKRFIERILIFILKKLGTKLLSHAYIQLGIAGYNGFDSTGESKALNWLKEILTNKNPILFDVGANDGTYSLLLDEKFPASAIYSFEPFPSTFIKAKNKLNGSPNILLYNHGFYKEDTTLNIYNASDTPNEQISSIYCEGLLDFYQITNITASRIAVKTIETFCVENNIQGIDFLKIDVEGAELDVLLGASSLLSSNAIKIIQFEFNDFNISARTFMKDFYKILTGFNFYRLSKTGLQYMADYSTQHEIFLYQNIIAVHKSIDKNQKNVHFR